jgi:hypothetical protein
MMRGSEVPMSASGYVEVDLFAKDVDTLDHPLVKDFRVLLEEVAEEYDCRLTSFQIHQGTVTFSFDDDVLMAEIIRILDTR